MRVEPDDRYVEQHYVARPRSVTAQSLLIWLGVWVIGAVLFICISCALVWAIHEFIRLAAWVMM